MCRQARWFAVLAVLFVLAGWGPSDTPKPAAPAKPTPNSANEPTAEKWSAAKSAEFLDTVALNWTKSKNCGTCHTNYPYLMARPVLKDHAGAAHDQVRKFFEGRVANWDRPKKEDKPRWDAEVVATAVSLAFNDALTTGKLHPMTRQALDRMWTVQRADGAWNWLKCNWPPYEHDDYFGAVWAALGAGIAPDGYAQTDTAKTGMAKLRKYLQEIPAPDLHHKTWLLWASLKMDGIMKPAEREATIKELLSLQRPDGGWNLPSLGAWIRHGGKPNDKNAPSDGYATGLVVYVLRQAGMPADREPIKKGADWLRSHQRASGRWFTRSLSNDRAHYITHAGTCFAVLALKACEGG